MLVKLMKHEFKSTRRFMLLLYGLLLITSVLSSNSLRFDFFSIAENMGETFQFGGTLLNLFSFTVIMLFVVMNVIVLVATYFFAIFRFKNNLLENEGYLMHTLPVKTADLLLSKTAVFAAWYFISFFAVLLSYAILFIGITSIPEIGTEFKVAFENLSRILHAELAGTNIILLSAEAIVSSVFAVFASLLRIFSAMAIGFSTTKNRVLKSIGIYILIGIIVSTIESIVSMLFGITQFSATADIDILSYFSNALWLNILLNGIYVLIYYLISKHFLTKKLNLL